MRQCSSGKRRFRNPSAAVIAAWRSEGKGSAPLYIYRCPECRSIHLTKQKQKGGGPLEVAARLDAR